LYGRRFSRDKPLPRRAIGRYFGEVEVGEEIELVVKVLDIEDDEIQLSQV
jgi:hypothetical protein